MPRQSAPEEGRRRIFQVTVTVVLVTGLYLFYTRLYSYSNMAAPLTIAGLQSLLSQHPSSSTTTSSNSTEPVPLPLSKYTNPTLLSTFLPAEPSSQATASASGSAPRLIMIGDVHGQLASLQSLLRKADYAPARGDRVVLTGDAINKGADSAGVAALAMAHGFLSVRGNHEDKVLRVWALAEAIISASASAGKGDDALGEWERALAKNDRAALATARSLSPAQREWVARLPVVLRIPAGSVPGPGRGKGEVIVVHAGLVPGLPLEAQDPWAVMNMRTLLYPKSRKKKEEEEGHLGKEDEAVFEEAVKKKLKDQYPTATPSDAEVAAEAQRLLEHYTSSPPPISSSSTTSDPGEDEASTPPPVPVDTREGRSWAKVWDELQRAKPAESERTAVVYGHDARKGLNIKEYTFGLDSGCVKGGELTALVFEPDGEGRGEEGAMRHRIVSVACEAADGHEEKSGKKKGKDTDKDKDKD